MNSEEVQKTLMEIYNSERRSTYWIHGTMERCRSCSGLVQVDAAAGVKEADELGGGGAQVCRCVVKGEVEDEKKKGEMERLFVPIYKERVNRRA